MRSLHFHQLTRRLSRQAFLAVRGLDQRRKRHILLAVDIATIGLAMTVALAMGQDRDGPISGLWAVVVGIMLFGGAASWGIGLPRIRLNAYDWSAVWRTAAFSAVLTGAAAGLAAGWRPGVPVAAFCLFALTHFALSVLGRIAMLRLMLWLYRRQVPQRRVVIYGAGTTGMQLAAALATHDSIDPVAFVDDNPVLCGLTVAGLPVLPPSELVGLVASRQIDRVLLAMPRLPRRRVADLVERLRPLGVEVHAVPSFAELAGEADLLSQIRPVPVEGLLGRHEVERELPGPCGGFAGGCVMVTGAGGSIGSELCRQLLACGPARLVLFDVSEAALYLIDRELRELAGRDGPQIVARLGSVTNGRLVRRLMAEFGVDAVLHAAAYKHVPLVEENQLTGLENNVIGSRVLAEAAREMKVGRFVLVSSDKAVRPRNVMGASKRMAELVVKDLAARPGRTCFSIVRFGNVLGSSGSVYPLFQEQIARGGPVTVTHDEATRYFMTIPEAARLVLTAGNLAMGGEVFVLDMGAPVPIRRMARQMIASAGLTVKDARHPSGDIEIRITGLRPGEKLHEELCSGTGRMATAHPKILQAVEEGLSQIEVANMLRDLQAAVDGWDPALARRTVLRWVSGNALEEEVEDAAMVAQAGG